SYFSVPARISVCPISLHDALPIYVEVRHGNAIRVEEALEDESVFERVEVGDLHRVRDHRTRTRSTARTDSDAVVLRPVDEVGDQDRKSTRLNSSHVKISYAVCCLK